MWRSLRLWEIGWSDMLDEREISPQLESGEVGLSERVYYLLGSAYRRAIVKAQPEVTAGHALYALVRRQEFDKSGQVFEWSRLAAAAATARPLIGFSNGTGSDAAWASLDQGSLDPADQSAYEAVASLREMRYEGIRMNVRGVADGDLPRWTNGMYAALEAALADARLCSLRHANELNLICGLLGDPGNRACELLERSRIDRDEVLRAVHAEPLRRLDGSPWLPAVGNLKSFGAIRGHSAWPVRLLAGALAVLVTSKRSRYRNGLMTSLEFEIVRQAVRLGHARISAIHCLLAVLALDAQVRISGEVLVVDPGRNCAADILRACDVTYPAALQQAYRLPESEAPVADSAYDVQRFGKARPGVPTWGVDAVRVLDEAVAIAGRRGHPDTGTAHLLVAMLDEPGGQVPRLLDGLGVDPGRVRSRISESAGLSTAEG